MIFKKLNFQIFGHHYLCLYPYPDCAKNLDIDPDAANPDPKH